MKELTRGQCNHIAGGDPGMSLAGGWGGFGSGGSSFGSGGIDFGGSSGGSSFDSVAVDFGSSVGSGFGSVWEGSGGFGSSVGSGFESVWEGSGGFEPSAGAGVWSLDAIGIEGGPMAVVTISGTPTGVPVFNNEPAIELHAMGEAPWEGQYLGQWQLPAPLSYAHTAFDGALIANTGRLAGTAAAAFLEGAVTGAIVGAPTTPIGQVGTLVIGGFVAVGAFYLLQHDHPTGQFESAPTGGKYGAHQLP